MHQQIKNKAPSKEFEKFESSLRPFYLWRKWFKTDFCTLHKNEKELIHYLWAHKTLNGLEQKLNLSSDEIQLLSETTLKKLPYLSEDHKHWLQLQLVNHLKETK